MFSLIFFNDKRGLTVTFTNLSTYPCYMSGDSSEDSRRIIIGTSSTPTNYTNQVDSFLLLSLVFKPLVKRSTTVTLTRICAPNVEFVLGFAQAKVIPRGSNAFKDKGFALQALDSFEFEDFGKISFFASTQLISTIGFHGLAQIFTLLRAEDVQFCFLQCLSHTDLTIMTSAPTPTPISVSFRPTHFRFRACLRSRLVLVAIPFLARFNVAACSTSATPSVVGSFGTVTSSKSWSFQLLVPVVDLEGAGLRHVKIDPLA